MPITFTCPCGKTLRAAEDLAGRLTRCPHCQESMRIPQADAVLDDFDALPPGLEGPGPETRDAFPDFTPTSFSTGSVFTPGVGEPAPFRPSVPSPDKRPPTSRSIREYAYVLLVFALVPLGFSLLAKEETDIGRRIEATLEKATPEQVRRALPVLQSEAGLTKEALLRVMPEGKLLGAHLAHDSTMHWVYAGIAAVGFLLLLLLFFTVERANPLHLLGIGAFTGTIGILFLLAVQACSGFRFGGIRGRGIVIVIILILCFIGWSYRSASDPDSNLLLSMVGFTFGVGLCEELTKAIPLLFYFKREGNDAMGWRGACLWGLASGIGFGVSEGVMYSGDSYNGLSGVDIYVVRFVSCVALHAMWSASVAITIARSVEWYSRVTDFATFAPFLLRALAVPMTLHGCYDTLLKKDMNAWALVVAVASFAWLAVQIEAARAALPGPKSGRVMA